MTNRSHLVIAATLVAWIAQAAVATCVFTAMVRGVDQTSIRRYSGFYTGYLTLFLIIYIPQFLFIFSPVAYLLRKLDQNGLIAAVLAGIAASLAGVGFNYIWLTPFATAGDHFDGNQLIEAYKQLSLEIVTVSGGAAAGCGYWLVANIKKISDRRRVGIRSDQPFREDDS